MIQMFNDFALPVAVMVFLDDEGNVGCVANPVRMAALSPDERATVVNDLLAELPDLQRAENRPHLRLVVGGV